MNDKRSPDSRLALRHVVSRVSGGLTGGEGSKKNNLCDNNLYKV